MDLKLDKAEVTVMPCRDYEEQNLDGSFTKIVGNFLGLDVVFSENDGYLYSFIIQKKNFYKYLEAISKGEKYFREASYKIDGTQWV